MPATATATRRGSGSPSGAIGRPPPVRAARGLGAQAQRREPQQQLSLVRSGIAGAQAGEGQRARGAGEVDDPGRLLGRRHARIPLKAERVDVGRRIGRASRVGHTAICGQGREPAKTRGVSQGPLSVWPVAEPSAVVRRGRSLAGFLEEVLWHCARVRAWPGSAQSRPCW